MAKPHFNDEVLVTEFVIGKYTVDILLQCTVGTPRFNNSALIYSQLNLNLQSFVILLRYKHVKIT